MVVVIYRGTDGRKATGECGILKTQVIILWASVILSQIYMESTVSQQNMREDTIIITLVAETQISLQVLILMLSDFSNFQTHAQGPMPNPNYLHNVYSGPC